MNTHALLYFAEMAIGEKLSARTLPLPRLGDIWPDNIIVAVLTAARYKRYRDYVITALRAGYPINAVDSEKKTVLHFAVHHQDLFLVRLALSCGADPNLVDMCGYTSVLAAVDQFSDSDMILRALLDAGGDVNVEAWCARTGTKQSVLALAALYFTDWNWDSGRLELLLDWPCLDVKPIAAKGTCSSKAARLVVKEVIMQCMVFSPKKCFCCAWFASEIMSIMCMSIVLIQIKNRGGWRHMRRTWISAVLRITVKNVENKMEHHCNCSHGNIFRTSENL